MIIKSFPSPHSWFGGPLGRRNRAYSRSMVYMKTTKVIEATDAAKATKFISICTLEPHYTDFTFKIALYSFMTALMKPKSVLHLAMVPRSDLVEVETHGAAYFRNVEHFYLEVI